MKLLTENRAASNLPSVERFHNRMNRETNYSFLYFVAFFPEPFENKSFESIMKFILTYRVVSISLTIMQWEWYGYASCFHRWTSRKENSTQSLLR